MQDRYRQPEHAMNYYVKVPSGHCIYPDRHTGVWIGSVKISDKYHEEYDGQRNGSKAECPHDTFVPLRGANDRI